MTTAHRWKDLEDVGYLVVRSYLSEQELKDLSSSFDTTKWLKAPGPKSNYGLKFMESPTAERMRPKLMATTAEIAAQTSIRSNLLAVGIYFATYFRSPEAPPSEAPKRQAFGWHQDHETWFMFQNHLNHLN